MGEEEDRRYQMEVGSKAVRARTEEALSARVARSASSRSAITAGNRHAADVRGALRESGP